MPLSDVSRFAGAAILLLLCAWVSPAHSLETHSTIRSAHAIKAKKDPQGLRRDTYYFVGWQFAVVGILYVSPESISGWSREQKDEKDFGSWWNHAKEPIWDKDDDFINYGLHPYWGAAYFVRARERGYGSRSAFWYSLALSSMYEFGLESVFENPSIQDLVVTPVVGSWLGGGFVRVREGIRKRVLQQGRYRRGDRWLLAATDPLGAVNQLTDRLIGRGTNLQVQPLVSRQHFRHPGGTVYPGDAYYGIKMSVRW